MKKLNLNNTIATTAMKTKTNAMKDKTNLFAKVVMLVVMMGILVPNYVIAQETWTYTTNWNNETKWYVLYVREAWMGSTGVSSFESEKKTIYLPEKSSNTRVEFHSYGGSADPHMQIKTNSTTILDKTFSGGSSPNYIIEVPANTSQIYCKSVGKAGGNAKDKRYSISIPVPEHFRLNNNNQPSQSITKTFNATQVGKTQTIRVNLYSFYIVTTLSVSSTNNTDFSYTTVFPASGQCGQYGKSSTKNTSTTVLQDPGQYYIDITFKPQTIGDKLATFTITGGNGQSAKINVSGTGLCIPTTINTTLTTVDLNTRSNDLTIQPSSFTAVADGTSISTNNFVLTSNNDNVVTILNDQTLHVTGAGSATITASVPKENKYCDNSCTFNVNVAKATPTISLSSVSGYVFETKPLTSTTTYDDQSISLTVNYSSNSGNNTIVNNDSIRLTKCESTTITATTVETGIYKSVSTTTTFTPAKVTPDLLWEQISPTLTYKNNYTIPLNPNYTYSKELANAGTIPTTTITSNNPAVTVENNTLKIVSATDYPITITYTLGGTLNSNATSTTQTITKIEKGAQTISWNDDLSGPYSVNQQLVDLHATANSGLDVEFSAGDAGIVTVADKKISFVKAGYATIAASQSGNDCCWNAAPNVTKSLKVDFRENEILELQGTTTVDETTAASLPLSDLMVIGGTLSVAKASGEDPNNEFHNLRITSNNTIAFDFKPIIYGEKTIDVIISETIQSTTLEYHLKIKATAIRKTGTITTDDTWTFHTLEQGTAKIKIGQSDDCQIKTNLSEMNANVAINIPTGHSSHFALSQNQNEFTATTIRGNATDDNAVEFDVTATFAETDRIASASKTIHVIINKEDASITLNPINDQYVFSTITPSLMGGGTTKTDATSVTYTYDYNGGTTTGASFKLPSIDDVNVTATTPATTVYKAGTSNTITVTPQRVTPTIVFGTITGEAYVGTDFILNGADWASAIKTPAQPERIEWTNEQVDIVYSTNLGTVDYDGKTLSSTKAGYATITAHINEAGNHTTADNTPESGLKIDFANDFALPFTGNVTVGGSQSQTFDMTGYFVPSGSYTAAVTSGSGEFSVSTISDNKITVTFAPTSVNSGSDTEEKTCTIQINDNGQTYTFKVKATAEKRTDTSLAINYTGETFAFSTITLSCTKETTSGVTYSANGTPLEGNTYKIPSTSQVTLTATTDATDIFKAGSSSVNINPKNVTPKVISWSGSYNDQKAGTQCAIGHADWDADETISGQPEKREWAVGEVAINYASSNSNIAEVRGSNLVFHRAGVATIEASIPGEKNHNASNNKPTKTVKVDFADAALDCGTAYAGEAEARKDITDMIVPAGTLTASSDNPDFTVNVTSAKIEVVYAPTTYEATSNATITFTDADGQEYHLNVTAGCVKHEPTVTWVDVKTLPVLDINSDSPLTQNALISECTDCDGLEFSSSNTNVALVLNGEGEIVERGTYLFPLNNGQMTITIYISETESRWGREFSETFTVSGVQATQISWPQDLQNLTTEDSQVTLEATAVTLTSNPTGQTITYDIVDDPDNIISITGNTMTFTGTGTARIKATATATQLYSTSEMEKDVRIVEPADETRCVETFDNVTAEPGATYEFRLEGHEDYYKVEQISYKYYVKGDRGTGIPIIGSPVKGADRKIQSTLYYDDSSVDFVYIGEGGSSIFDDGDEKKGNEQITIDAEKTITSITFSGPDLGNFGTTWNPIYYGFTNIKVTPRSFLEPVGNTSYTFGSNVEPILAGETSTTEEMTFEYSFLNSPVSISFVNFNNDDEYSGKGNFSYQVTKQDIMCDYGEMKLTVSFHPSGTETYHKCRLKLTGLKGEELVTQYLTLEGYANRNEQTIIWGQDLDSWNSMSGEVFFVDATTSAGLPVTQFDLIQLETTPGAVELTDGNKLTIKKSGHVKVKASHPGNDIYLPVELTREFDIERTEVGLHWDNEYADDWIYVFDTKPMTAVPGNEKNTGAIKYVVASGNASFSGNDITINRRESIRVMATIAETDVFKADTITKTFMPAKVTPVVTWDDTDFKTDLSHKTFTLTDEATVSETDNQPDISNWSDGKTVTYSSGTEAVATLQSGKTFNLHKVGYATINAKVEEGNNNEASNNKARHLKVDFNTNDVRDFEEVGINKKDTIYLDLDEIVAEGTLTASSDNTEFTLGSVVNNRLPIIFSPKSHDESNPEKTATITIHDADNSQDYHLKVKGTSILTSTKLKYNDTNHNGWQFVVKLPNETTTVVYGGTTYDIDWEEFHNADSRQQELSKIILSLKNPADDTYVDIIDNSHFIVKQANADNDNDVEVVLLAKYPGIAGKIDSTSIEIPIKIEKNQYSLNWGKTNFDIEITEHSKTLAPPTLNLEGGESEITYSFSKEGIATYDGNTLTLTGNSYESVKLTATIADDQYAKGTSAELQITIKKTDQYVSWNGTEISSGFTTQKSTEEGIVLQGKGKHDDTETNANIKYTIVEQTDKCGENDLVSLVEDDNTTPRTTTLYYTGNGSGKVKIRAIAEDNEEYNESKPKDFEFTISKEGCSVTDFTVTTDMHYGDNVTLAPTIDKFTKDSNYGYTMPSVTGTLETDGNILNVKGIGTGLTISAKKQEDCWVTESADKVSNTFNIAKSEQEIEWDKTALGTPQDGAYHFTVLDNTEYQLRTQAIDKLHKDADATCLTLVDGKYVTANVSGDAPLDLVYSIEEQNGVCKVGEDKIVSVDTDGKMHITGNGTGTVLVIASVDGGEYYENVSETIKVVVDKVKQTINWDQTFDETYDIFSTIVFKAATDADGTGQNNVYYTWTQISTCDVPVFGHVSQDNIIDHNATDGALILAAGTVTVTARHNGNEKYLPDSCSSKKTFTINVGTPTINWSKEYTDNQSSGTEITLEATSNYNRSNVQYEIKSMTVAGCASLNGNRLTCVAPGQVTVRAYQEAIPCVIDSVGILQTIKIGQGPHAITWTEESYSYKNTDGTIDLSTLCTCKTGDITFTSSDDNIAEVSGNDLTIKQITSEESVTITASVDGNDNYEASSETRTFTITIEPLTITINGGSSDPIDLGTTDPIVTSVTNDVDFATLLKNNNAISCNYNNVTYTFISSDETIAEFDNEGKIIAYKKSDEGLSVTVTAHVEGLTDKRATMSIKIPRGTMVFNRDGSWDAMLEDGSNWQRRDIQAPTAEDHNVSIAANCTVNVTTAECWDMEIADNGTLTISTDGILNVADTLLNNDASKLVIAADANGQGTLVFHNKKTMPMATVEMWCKGSEGDINPNWQYRGIAVSLATLTENAPGLIYQWSETAQESEATEITEQWTKVTNSTMSAWTGYAVAKYTVGGADYKTSAAGALTNADQEITLAYTANQTSEGVQSGFNLITNSFTAPIRIKDIVFGDETEEDEVTEWKGVWKGIVLFNTGKYVDWKNSDKEIREGNADPGQYLFLPKYTAEAVATTELIPSGESFFVVAYQTGKTVQIPYSAVDSLKRSGPLKMPERREIYGKLIVEVDGGEGADRLYLLENKNRIRGFENGYDGPKYAGTKGNPMLYATTDDGRMSVSADSSLLGLYIGFAAGKHDVTYTMTFDASALSGYSELYLYDTREKRYTNILDGGSYTFKGLVGGEDKRFKIVGSREDGESVTGDDQTIIVTGNRFHVTGYDNADERIYLVDMTGKILWETSTAFGPWFDIPTDLPTGVYIIKTANHTAKMVVK